MTLASYSFVQLAFGLLGTGLIAVVTYAIYNLYFHPLASYPGPLLWRAFRFSQLHCMLQGRLPYRVKELHDRYGHIVRTAPDELSFIHPAAWRDIYWRKQQLLRPNPFRNRSAKNADNFISAAVPVHKHFRRVFAPAFTDAALRDQEPIIQDYVTKLMGRLHEVYRVSATAANRHAGVVDMVEWINYATFDIISDLSWGTSFNCLESKRYHTWISIVLHFKALLIRIAMNYYAFLTAPLLPWITPTSAMEALKTVNTVTEERIKRRLEQLVERPDILSYALKHNTATEAGMSLTVEELEANSMTFIVAGSEQVTTALAGTLNYLLRNPTSMRTLAKEVRSAFQNEGDITAAAAAALPYLNAVLNEGMRLCPPVPDSMRRVATEGGITVAGEFIPEGMVVSMPCWATFQAEDNFSHASEFHPERWLATKHSIYTQDRKEAFRPFSLGQADCIGQQLAWLEMRVILSRLVWNFDLGVPDGEEALNWSSQKIFWSWDKEPVRIKLSAVH